MILRCTVKLLKLIGLNPRDLDDPYSEDRRSEWYGDLLWFDRRKCLLFTHSQTLFSFLIADVLKNDLLPIGRFLVNHLEIELLSESLPADTFGPLDPSDVFLAKTADRSVLGCMNDLAIRCECAVRIAGGLSQLDVSDLNRRLRRTFLSLLGNSYPIDRALELARDSSV